MDKALQNKVCEERRAAEEAFITIETLDGLDDQYRSEFLGMCHAYGEQTGTVKVYEYIVCFRGQIEKAYPFLEMLTPLADRFEWAQLRTCIKEFRRIVDTTLALACIRPQSPSVHLGECSN
jgi:hypothetical protein